MRTIPARILRGILLYTCILSFNLTMYAQKYTFKDMYADINIDSLNYWVKTHPQINEERLKNLIKIEVSYLWLAHPKTFSNLDEIEKLSRTLNHLLGKTFGKLQRGIQFSAVSKNNEALQNYSEALKSADELKDVSLSLDIMLYQSMISLNFSGEENNVLSNHFIKRATDIFQNSKNPHDQLFFLIAALSNEGTKPEAQSNKILMNVIVNRLNTLYKTHKELSYGYFWIKDLEIGFNHLIKNHEKAIVISKELISRLPKNNYYLLSKTYRNLGMSCIQLNRLDEASKYFDEGIKAFKLIQPGFYIPAVNESKYFWLLSLFKGQRQLAMINRDLIKSNSLADSILLYQKLGNEESNERVLLHIQSEYNFKKFESEFKNLSKSKQIALLNQQKLQLELNTKVKNLEVVKYRAKLKSFEDKIKYFKAEQKIKSAELTMHSTAQKNNELMLYMILGVILLITTLLFLGMLRNKNRKIEQIASFKSQFYTVLVHDLRGSINSLNDIGKVLSHLITTRRFEEIDVVANQIEKVSCETALMLDNTIDWGISDSYPMYSTPKDTNLSILIYEIFKQYESAIKSKKITAKIQIPPDVMISTNAKCITVIIRNMIANAKSNTPINGFITINVNRKDNNNVSISVQNSGKGISSKNLSFFREIFNGEKKPEVGENGLGLGIILINQYAKKINAKPSVMSQNNVTDFSLHLKEYKEKRVRNIFASKNLQKIMKARTRQRVKYSFKNIMLLKE